MSGQNRFLLPHTGVPGGGGRAAISVTTSAGTSSSAAASLSNLDDQENQLSVDTNFDLYWEEEARNPQRNRIRIGRQYQATVPPLLKSGESDLRNLAELETLSFCPKRSAKLSNAELDHYFTVAKSLNLFASLVETRSLLGRDVTIADLNHIRNKEGLSLASVIQPSRQSANYNQTLQLSSSSLSCQQTLATTTMMAPTNNATNSTKVSPIKSPPSSLQSQDNKPSSSTTLIHSPSYAAANQPGTLNQPLMRALSHFISLHHPCQHDVNCKKLNKDMPIESESTSAITVGNLRQMSSVSNSPARGRSRLSLKQQQVASKQSDDVTETNDNLDQDQASSDNATQSTSYEDWTREEVELFSKAIEVCGKNFGSIKKEFLPTKSVRSIVEYYYIGSRDVSEGRKKPSQNIESGECCNSPDKFLTNFSRGGSGDGAGGDASGPSSSTPSSKGSTSTSSNRQATNSENESRTQDKSLSDSDRLTLPSSQKNLSAKTKTDYLNGQAPSKNSFPSKPKTNPRNIDARLSVYNFDDEFKDEESSAKLECPPRPGAEVKPLKAKPIVPGASLDNEAGNSNVGSLKFFMDGQLVLKLNACQDQQEGADKCHWVQSGERILSQSRQKRSSKRANSDNRAPSEQSLNGSYSNSALSSNNDEDDSKNDDLSMDEDSKESANSFINTQAAQRPKKQSTPKRQKTNKPCESATPVANNLAQSSIDYNRLAINNRMKERTENLASQSPISTTNPLLSQAANVAAANLPNWLQANQFAMAAAILTGLPFPAAAAAAGNMMQSINNSAGAQNHLQQSANNTTAINMATSKPIDLSLEQAAPKPILSKSSSRSRKQKN